MVLDEAQIQYEAPPAADGNTLAERRDGVVVLNAFLDASDL